MWLNSVFGFLFGAVAHGILSFFVARYGEQRKIGFMNALLISLILSPLIGFLVASLSERKDDNHNNSKSATEFDIEQFRKN